MNCHLVSVKREHEKLQRKEEKKERMNSTRVVMI